MAQPIPLPAICVVELPRLPSPGRARNELGALEAACFEAHPDPQFAVEADGAVVAWNRAARELLHEAKGPRALAEAIVAHAGAFMREMPAAIEATLRTQTPSAELELAIPVGRFSVRVLPIESPSQRVLVALRRAPPRDERTPRERFGFTPTESRVAELLCRGLTPARIARELGVSVETVRCHLKQAFMKAGVHRQAELVATLLGA
jgi:DNA-binding CsgD family transcriptional regulator